ncbi:hypothetical protein [Microbacterium sp. EST19A]|uniref:hypothetical protein n=1 Tax=Microbacterium sp. EST19A TaxID=2862681 RepID=UPI001CBCA165|nr:hypothetical protein [Microbacterium sp. EST19A]
MEEQLPALFINFALLVVSGIGAVVAVVQARAALRDAGKAETARDEAISAQKASAVALEDANRIAADARDLLRRQDARDTERHDVRWEPIWQESTGKWILGNRGQDTAFDVRMVTDATVIGEEAHEEAEVPPRSGLSIQLPARFIGTGHTPIVDWRVEWRTPLGSNLDDSGRWPVT